MAESRIVQFILQFLFSTIGCLFFRAAGLLVLALVGGGRMRKKEVGMGAAEMGAGKSEVGKGEVGKSGAGYGRGFLAYFYPCFHGITFCIALYAVIQSHFLSIYILILGVYLGWLAAGIRGWGQFSLRSVTGLIFNRWVEVALICLLFLGIYHLLPEWENRQYDCFFYLKVTESLNLTGQENVHAYNNVFDQSFHGVEPYHYTEIWLNALLLRVTGNLLPGIQVFRYIGYTILSVFVVYGLWGTYEAFSGRRAGWWARAFCIAFLFFLPDVMPYSALLRHYIGFAFTNNFVEVLNFRTIYLCLIPFLLSLREEETTFESVVYFICLGVVSYLCFLVLIPAVFILVFLRLVWPGMGITRRSLMQKGLLAAGTALLYGMFYSLFANKVIGGFYQQSFRELLSYLRVHNFYVYASFLTTLVYILGIVFVYTGFFWIKKSTQALSFWRENRGLIAWCGVMIVTGVGIARILMYQDNAYQVAYFSYILAGFFIFIFWCYLSAAMRSNLFWQAGIGLFVAGYVLFKAREGKWASINVFNNGSTAYRNQQYTQLYLEKVTGYLKGRSDLVGGYLGDSSYYRQIDYFGLRNPNTNFPPISYIIAGRNISNYEFCLSDTAAILTDIDRSDNYEMDYLHNAIGRSGFYFYQKRTGLQGREALKGFIRSRHLQYLIVSGKSCEAEVADIPVRDKFEDLSTGEIFLVLQTP